ncbi:hypothetical protein FACS1894189_7890 [Planctomycetales bacterium]|nr:hypothetical protein FACS1894189_7890 [Planctomycetales bacterium]
MLRTFFFILLFSHLFAGSVFADPVIQKLFEMSFETDAHGWRAEQSCRAALKNNVLFVEATGETPSISKFVDQIGGKFYLTAKIRTRTNSRVSLYWTTKGSPRRDEVKKVTIELQEDAQWHDYQFEFSVQDFLTGLVFRFSTTDGSWDIQSITLVRESPPPLSVRKVEPIQYKTKAGAEQNRLRFTVSNDVTIPMKFHIGSEPEELTLQPHETVDLAVLIEPEGNLAAVNLILHPNEFPDIIYPVFLYYPDVKTDWIKKPISEGRTLEIAPDARLARIKQGEDVFAIIAPLVHHNGIIPKLTLSPKSTETQLQFEGDDLDLKIEIDGSENQLHFVIDGKAKQTLWEGPAVRLFGTLQNGLLPGVEFLGVGDSSSSIIDLESPFHDRSRPARHWITMPLALLETEKGGIVLHWDDMMLQPTFSAPNQFDHTDDHRVSLIGSKIDATLELLLPTQKDDESATFRVLRAYIAKQGFPEPPAAPRTTEEQRELSMRAMSGSLQSETGGEWGYALETDWKRKPFADMFSTMIRLAESGQGRQFPNPVTLEPGGADITNDAVYFVTGRVEEWKAGRESAMQSFRAMRNPDGSFLYRTRFPEVETAVSSFGYTALKTLEMMEYVRLTGDEELFVSVEKSLEYLRQCDIPRGGFFRDSPFHTPDLQTAATMIWLYVWAYEYSGNTKYLDRAKHFAFSGLPFVYRWTDRDKMLYLTVPKFGGTNRRPPLDFGVSRPRVGIQYAYALLLLTKYDQEADWKKLANGILHAVEKIQYTDDTEAGCIPALFEIETQERKLWKVNPCALVSLRLLAEGKLDSLFVLTDGAERYVSPYPIKKTPRGIEALNVPIGRKFQVLHNGSRINYAEGAGLIPAD